MPQVILPCTADAYVYTYSTANQSTNYGTTEDLSIQYFCQSYLQFALTGIPAGATINWATLNLTAYDKYGQGANMAPSNNDYAHLYRVDSAWTETGVTYTGRPVRGPHYYTWNYNGSAAQAQYGAVMPNLGTFTISISELVQYWFTGGANYGLLMKAVLYPEDGAAPTPAIDINVYSRNSSYSPTVTVDYTPPIIIEEGTASATGRATQSFTAVRVLERSATAVGTATASFGASVVRGGVHTVTGRSTASIIPVRVIEAAQASTGTATVSAPPFRLVGGSQNISGLANAVFEIMPQRDGTVSVTGRSSFTANSSQITGSRSATSTARATVTWIPFRFRLVESLAAFDAAALTTMLAHQKPGATMIAAGAAGIEGIGHMILAASPIFVGTAIPSATALVYGWDNYKKPADVGWSDAAPSGTVWTEARKPPNPWRDRS